MIETRRERAVRLWRESDWAEVAAFLGPNAHRFEGAWAKTRDKMAERGAGIAWSWSWPALLFSFGWFFYRRQWAIGAVLLILPIALALLLERAPGTLGAFIVIAVMGKSLVVQDAVNRIAKIKEKGGGMAKITAAGGVSIPGAILGGLILAIGAAGVLLIMFDAGQSAGGSIIRN